jgi:cyclic pyranopterin monophosphate synthase
MPNKTARHLRNHATEAETALWQLLRRRQIFGHRFRRQHPIGPFITDFVCLERRVIIEADGFVHESTARQNHDIERDQWLESQQFRVLRLTNEVILTDPEPAIARIQSFLGVSQATTVHHPLPSPPPLRGRERSRAQSSRNASPKMSDVSKILSHLDDKGQARMVDVSDKATTSRTARAEGFVAMQPETLALIESGEAKKGDVLATARIAGIMAAKKTHELIPLCHPLSINKAQVDFVTSRSPVGIHVAAEVKVSGPTGVEMEALTAVSVACLTIYDMLKAADKSMTISDIRLIEKTGGRSGTYKAAL